jgi:DNA-binding MarR family transcriptional regulator
MTERTEPRAAAGRANGEDRTRAVDFGDLDDFVGFQLHRARNVAATVLHHMIAPEFVPGHFPILYLIGRNPGRTQSAIAKAVGLDRSSLVPILNRFEKSGWVRRIPSEGDRRAHALRLTRAGERKVKELYDKVNSIEERISAELGDDGQRSMLALLHRIQDLLDPAR